MADFPDLSTLTTLALDPVALFTTPTKVVIASEECASGAVAIPMSQIPVDLAAYARALAIVYASATSGNPFTLSADEAQALVIMHALSVVALKHRGRLPIIPIDTAIAKVAADKGVALDPTDSKTKNAWIVVAPYGAATSEDPAGRDASLASTPDVMLAGRKSIRLIQNSKNAAVQGTPIDSSNPAVKAILDALLKPSITVTPNQNITTAAAIVITVLGVTAIVTGGIFATKAVSAKFSADADVAKSIAATNATLAAELNRQKIVSKGGTDPGVSTQFADTVKTLSGQEKTTSAITVAVGVAVIGAIGGLVYWISKKRPEIRETNVGKAA